MQNVQGPYGFNPRWQRDFSVYVSLRQAYVQAQREKKQTKFCRKKQENGIYWCCSCKENVTSW